MPVRRHVHAGQAPERNGPVRQAARVVALGEERVPGGVGARALSDLYQAPARTGRIEGEWASKANTYGVTKTGRMYRSKATTAWEAEVRAIAAQGAPLEGPVAMVVLVRSATDRKDAHNIQKALLDGGESRLKKGRTFLDTGRGWYRNDKQVKPLLIVPLPPGPPVTIVALWPWRGHLGAWLAAALTWIMEEGYA